MCHFWISVTCRGVPSEMIRQWSRQAHRVLVLITQLVSHPYRVSWRPWNVAMVKPSRRIEDSVLASSTSEDRGCLWAPRRPHERRGVGKSCCRSLQKQTGASFQVPRLCPRNVWCVSGKLKSSSVSLAPGGVCLRSRRYHGAIRVSKAAMAAHQRSGRTLRTTVHFLPSQASKPLAILSCPCLRCHITQKQAIMEAMVELRTVWAC